LAPGFYIENFGLSFEELGSASNMVMQIVDI